MPTMITLSPTILGRLIRLHPVSIILTGSSAAGEAGPRSDQDVMVVFSDDDYVERKELQRFASGKTRLYPFRQSEISSLSAPHPFPNVFYWWWITRNAKTIWGKKIVENLRPAMRKNDLREALAFERGVALAAMHAFRNDDLETAKVCFSKSCLFGTIAGVGLRTGKTPSSYKDAMTRGVKIFAAHAKLIEKAERMRKKGDRLAEQDIYDNLKYMHALSAGIG